MPRKALVRGTVKDKLQDRKLRELERRLPPRPETKYLNSVVTAQTYAASTWLNISAAQDNLCECGQGTAVDSRIGNDISVRHIKIKMFVVSPASDDDTTLTNNDPLQFRLILFVNKNTNGAVTDFNKMFDSGAGGAPLIYQRDRTNNDFIFLYDKIHTFEPKNISVYDKNGTSSSRLAYSAQRRYIEFSHTFKKPLIVKANSSSNAITAYDNNTIGLAWHSNQASPLVSYNCRVLFDDN